MPDLNTILVGGFAIAPLVVGLVALAKMVGVPVKYAPYLNGGLSTLLYVGAIYLLPMYPAAEPFVNVVVGAVVIFLGSSGIYQFGKTVKG